MERCDGSAGVEIDPVCGMKVEPAKAAVSTEHQGKTYYFCGKGCAAKFQGDPARWLTPAETKPLEAAAMQVEYVCPMDREVSRMGPGTCPKCGMALEPAEPGAAMTKTEYTCPMHPEIVQAQPANCPICGMALEPWIR